MIQTFLLQLSGLFFFVIDLVAMMKRSEKRLKKSFTTHDKNIQNTRKTFETLHLRVIFITFPFIIFFVAVIYYFYIPWMYLTSCTAINLFPVR